MSEVKIGGIGISGSKWLIIIPLIGTIVGGAYGGFELWHRYQAMEAKINKYVAPDLSGIRSELKVTQTKLEEALDDTYEDGLTWGEWLKACKGLERITIADKGELFSQNGYLRVKK